MFISDSRIGVLGMAVSAVLVWGVAAEAGILATNSGGAMAGYTGSQLYSDSNLGFTVLAEVDYAVFAPGAFGIAFPGEDTSGGTDYVYAYQIANLDDDILSFTVGLDGDEPLGAISSVGGIGLIDPTAASYVGTNPTSAAWDFNSGALINGTSSAVLFFTSAAPPEWAPATVSTGWADTHNLPSPTPEPATLGLMAIGLGLICVRKRR